MEKEKKKLRRERIIEVKRLVEEWEIWDKEKEVVKSEGKAKKLVPERFHKWIHIFDKKANVSDM